MSDINDFVPLWGIWQIDSLIGEGSFGKVYKAVREEFGNKYYCAIKHISVPESENEVKQYLKENASTDITTAKVYYHQLVSDITNEINTMYSLSGNTNIVTYQEHKITEKPDGVGFDILIKMELLTELSDKVREQSLTQQEIVKLGVDICTALEVCAAKKLIHRDIKPQNIFISEEGNYKLGDFGISRQLEKTVNGLSKKGTPRRAPTHTWPQRSSKARTTVQAWMSIRSDWSCIACSTATDCPFCRLLLPLFATTTTRRP